MKTDLFQSCGHCWVFQISWHIECSTLTVSSLHIWNSSTGILSPPLALFAVMLPKVHLTSHSRRQDLGEGSHHHDYLGHEDLFCTVLCSNCQHPLDHGKSKSSRKISISALLTMPKPLTVWITINCGKLWKRWEYQTTWPASWETCIQVRKQQLELDMEQQTDSK